MHTRNGTYHRILRVTSLALALALIFESGLLSEGTARLADTTQQYLANAVGVSVGVPETELNRYTAELTARERELEAREAALEEREIAVNLNTQSTEANGSDTTTYLLASVLFILLVLILLNYVLDYLRVREERMRTRQAV